MEPRPELVDELFRAKVEQARRMTPEDKLLAGLRLFELVRQVMADGIRHERPAASEDEVRRILAERIALWRRLEDAP